jgi:hypothetical protein
VSVPEPWPAYDREIRRIQDRLELPAPLVPYDGGDDEPPVQLSVRLSPRLRHDLAQIARRDTTSVTAFVTEALEEAVRVASDPFAGLAARMTADFRAELGRATESGAYAEAAAEVDRLEDGEQGW